jgi:hypothetical protein
LSNFDVILAAQGELLDSAGTKTADYQSIIVPRGKGEYMAFRTRETYASARWGGWSFGELNRVSVSASGVTTCDDVVNMVGFAHGKTDLSAPGTFAPVYDGSVAETTGAWGFRDKQTNRTGLGFVVTSHKELSEIDVVKNEIPKTLGARLSKVFGADTIGKVDATEVDVTNWRDTTGTAAFTVSRWDKGLYPTRPQGAYSYAPFTGNASAPAAAGAKVATEKRTFDKEYTRPNGDVYYGRKIGEHEDVDVLTKARENGQNVLAYGPPGTGKTAVYEAAFGSDLITVLGTAETETSDFIGSYTQRPGEGYVWVDGPLVQAMEQGKALLIDEIGLVDPKVLSIVYSVMDGRGELNVTQNPDRGTVHAADGFYIVAATNPDAPGVILSEALLSRFTVQVEIDSDYELARHLGVSKKIVRAAETLDKKRRAGETLWAPQMRELFAVKNNTAIFGEDFALRSLIASCPSLDRDTACDVLSKAVGTTLTPLRMEG